VIKYQLPTTLKYGKKYGATGGPDQNLSGYLHVGNIGPDFL